MKGMKPISDICCLSFVVPKFCIDGRIMYACYITVGVKLFGGTKAREKRPEKV